jgi:PPM family protein phosphatase
MTSQSELAIGAYTDMGVVRKRNEDSIVTEPTSSAEAHNSGWLGIVADGMGGRNSGDVASKLAVNTTRDWFYQRSSANTQDRLRAAVEQSNATVFRCSQSAAENDGMGTTITAAVIRGSRLTIAHVGDSRAYLIRNSRIKQITRDHSLVDEMIRSGQLTREDARHHPRRNVITRALGALPTVDVDVSEEPLHDGDVVVLCSDGLYRVVTDADIARALIAEPQQAAESLVALANERGGPDNISVIVVRIAIADDEEVTLTGNS